MNPWSVLRGILIPQRQGTPSEPSNSAIRFALRLRRYEKLQLEKRMEFGEYYYNVYKKPEKDSKGDTVYKLVEIESGIDCALEQINPVCVRDDGEYVSTDSFKYCARVIPESLKWHLTFTLSGTRMLPS